ncbi:Fc.00g007290.m01.CDS01 [Cosmosporella sp. VM-42]
MVMTRSQTKTAQAAKSNSRKRYAPPTSNTKSAKKLKRETTKPVKIASTSCLGDSAYEKIPSPKPRTFGQDITIPRYPTVDELGMLEFYQAYPHNRGATLCTSHFVYLAMKWYQRRYAATKTHRMQAKTYTDDFSRGSEPDFSKLSIPIRNDGLLMSLEEFAACILNSVSAAKKRLLEERSQIMVISSDVAVCEISGDEPLSCNICVDKTEETILEDHAPSCWEPGFQSAEDDHIDGCVVLGGGEGDKFLCDRCPLTDSVVEIYPSRMAVNSNLGRASVGGLHFIVDTCGSEPMIKFRSTRFSEAHEADRCAGLRKGLVCEELCDVLGIFEPAECSAFFENCVCATKKTFSSSRGGG